MTFSETTLTSKRFLKNPTANKIQRLARNLEIYSCSSFRKYSGVLRGGYGYAATMRTTKNCGSRYRRHDLSSISAD